MGIYESLGVRRLINADARLTRLGGSLMPPEVLDAMREAAESYVDIHELQGAAGRELAALTRNEAAYITTGAAAGLVVATLACMIGDDLRTLARVIEGETPERHEVIIHRAHRIPYDPAVRLAGGRIVEVGNVLQTFPWEMEAAITSRTAMVLYIAGGHVGRGALPLEETIEIAHRHGVPVVVDAAAQLPPVENLWRFTREYGADLAVFSGGKDLRGPQSSGMVVGRADLISSLALHGAPYQRLGRPMKVGKEEMVGLVAAVRRYVTLDHEARLAGFEATVQRWVDGLAGIPGVTARRDFPNEAGQPTPRLRVDIDAAVTGITAREAQRRLFEGDPGVAVAAWRDEAIFATPDTLDGANADLVLERLRAVLQPSLVASP